MTAATPHYVGRNDIGKSFPARWFGKCASCGDSIHVGDDVLYVNGDLVLAHDCIPATHTQSDADENHGEDLGSTAANRTMPRGGKASQRCSVCFIIPASNGTCGCM